MNKLAAFIFLLLLFPVTTFASSVIRSGENISIATDQTVEGDFYSLSNTSSISGEITGDLLISSAKVTINGKVDSDLAAAAGEVDVHGIIGDDARIVAGEVTIAGEVKGDLVVVASSLKVLSTAKIDGDIIFFGSNADISGVVQKNILGTSESIRIDGTVGGDIDIKTNTLTLGDRTDVTGMIKYTSANELVRAQNARVTGKVVKNDPVIIKNDGLRDLMIPLLIMLFAALVWFLFFRRMLNAVVLQTNKHPLRSMLVGFGLFFLIPIASMILLISTLGSLLGVTLLFIYFVLTLISLTISGIIISSYLAKLINKPTEVTMPLVIIGTLVAFACMFVPVVGFFVFIAALLTTLGALTIYLYRLVKFS